MSKTRPRKTTTVKELRKTLIDEKPVVYVEVKILDTLHWLLVNYGTLWLALFQHKANEKITIEYNKNKIMHIPYSNEVEEPDVNKEGAKNFLKKLGILG